MSDDWQHWQDEIREAVAEARAEARREAFEEAIKAVNDTPTIITNIDGNERLLDPETALDIAAQRIRQLLSK